MEREVMMNRMNHDLEYTSDAGIDSIRAGDPLVELVGVITEVTAPKTVGNGTHRLLKFIVSNNSNRLIQCLIWNETIHELLPWITPNRIIHIDGASARAAHLAYRRQDVVLYPIELSIQATTVVKFGDFHDEGQVAQEDPVNSTLLNLATANGLIQVDAYLKTQFVQIGRTDAGRGSICDVNRKVIVRVLNYQPVPNLIKGQKVRLIGRTEVLDGKVQLLLQNSWECILPLDEHADPVMIANCNEILARADDN